MIPYILNVGLVLAGCLAFYKLLLKKETFYKINRYMLILCLLIAFTLPLIHVPRQLSLRKAEPTVVTNYHASLNNLKQQNTTAFNKANTTAKVPVQINDQANNSFSWNNILQWTIWLYWFGVIVFAFNFLVQMFILIYRTYTSPFIKDGKFRIVEVSGDKAPCSFANAIFINPGKYDWETYNQILQHEKIHIQQKHTLDILFAELMLILQWFNPFAWLYRKEVESNLEFLTDDQLVQKEKIEKEGYQLNLLKVSAPHFPLSLTTNYNQSLLKTRIAMMNTKRSSVRTAWKYFFLLPLLIAFASLLNEPVVKAQDNTTSQNNSAKDEHHNEIRTEGYWFATIKDDKVNFRFANDESDHDSYNNSEFLLSELPALPKGTNGDFKITRDAGTMNFNGKFDGNQGMGRYKFAGNNDFANFMNTQGIGKLNDEDMMAFFFVNVTKEYTQMIKTQFSGIDKDNLIAMSALKIDKTFIASIK
ncbi:MAG: M56 family metallopeptidase, partial [Parafilimonas sp.]|nr:M56 family metallopeptidase [Parafilimonas sp.]